MNAPPIFFDHSRHKLWVRDLEPSLDVLAFHGEERLSQPFCYHIEFTSTEQDLAAQQLLGQDAGFSLHAIPIAVMPWETLTIEPLRTLQG